MWPSVLPVDPLSESLLSEVASLTYSIATCRNHVDGKVLAYQRWVEDSVVTLSNHFLPEDVERLVRTPSYWETIDVPADFPQVQKIVNNEIDAIERRLKKLSEELAGAKNRWGPDCRWVVVDTNVYIEHDVPFYELDWHSAVDQRPDRPLRLVVPLMVLDELDGLKVTAGRDKQRGGQKGWRIRDTLRRFEVLLECERSDVLGRNGGQVTIEVLPDPLLHHRLNVNDAEIVARSVALQRLVGGQVFLVSNDTNMLIRARQAGVRPVRLVPLVREPMPTE